MKYFHHCQRILLLLDNIRSQIDNQNINFYIDYIVNSLFEANKYFNDQEPWKKKDDKIRLNLSLIHI